MRQSDTRHAGSLEGPELSPRRRMQAAGDDQPRVSVGERHRGARIAQRRCRGAGQSRRTRQHQLWAAECRAGEGLEVAVGFGVGNDDLVSSATERADQVVVAAAYPDERQEGDWANGATAEDLGDVGRGTRIRRIPPDGRLVGGYSAHPERPMQDGSLLTGKGGTEERRPSSARREERLQLGPDRAPERGVDLLEEEPTGEARSETPRRSANELGSLGGLETAALGVHRRHVPLGAGRGGGHENPDSAAAREWSTGVAGPRQVIGDQRGQHGCLAN